MSTFLLMMLRYASLCFCSMFNMPAKLSINKTLLTALAATNLDSSSCSFEGLMSTYALFPVAR